MKKRWIVVLLAINLFACKKDHPIKTSVIASGIPVTITLNQAQRGQAVPTAFQGLSFETAILGENPNFLNVNNIVFIQLLKNLGQGMFRIGGDTSDETAWTGSARTANTADNSLTTTDVDRLAALPRQPDGRCCLG